MIDLVVSLAVYGAELLIVLVVGLFALTTVRAAAEQDASVATIGFAATVGMTLLLVGVHAAARASGL